MTYSLRLVAASAIAAGFCAAASADGNFAVTGSVGTTGGAIEGQVKVNELFQLRAGANYLAFDETIDVDDISYDGDVDFSGFGAFVDVHPFGGSFFVTGGAYTGAKEIDLIATSDVAVDIGGVPFTPTEYGRLEGDVSFDDLAPFVGFGFDTTFEGSGNWGFSLVAGAALFGSGDVSLESVDGTRSNDPIVQAAIAQEVREIEDEIEDYELWPVLQVGLSYRF